MRLMSVFISVLFAATAQGIAAEEGRPTGPARDFWSLRDLRVVQPPVVADGAWVRNSVDAFVLAELERRKLRPAKEASRITVVRRLYFDLTGLPPTLAELTGAVSDGADDWYERLVDRLLNSPAFGERWARHWLDLARFAESDGYESDSDRPTAWRYRDFVVRAFNDDMPYDRFLLLQLAGDECAEGDATAGDLRAGTGFIAAAVSLVGKDGTKREKEERRYDELDDIVSTTGSAILGLTIGCARCHDHKYDPITSLDYYRLAATFSGIKRVPGPVLTPNGTVAKFNDQDRLGEPLCVVNDPSSAAPLHLLGRGDVEKRLEPVTFGVPVVLDAASNTGSPAPWLPAGNDHVVTDAGSTGRRTAIAKWLTDPQKGAGALAARVVVNRLWQHHFGEGIVRTPGDFGRQGDRPSHPDLLEYLSGELVHGGWRLKTIHRLIVTSAAYRQDIAYETASASADPENRLLWRRRPIRNEAEVLRDSILAVSGKLDRSQFGPSIKPAIPAQAMPGRNKDGVPRPTSDGPEQWRRTVYLFTKRSLPIPWLTTFDAPHANATCSRRAVSTVPTQALALMNDPFVVRQARFFAQRCIAESGTDARSAIRHAYRLALSREPSDAELATWLPLVVGADGRTTDDDRLAGVCQAIFSLNEFAYVD